MRLTPSARASVRVPGRPSPGFRRPRQISSTIARAICRNNGRAAVRSSASGSSGRTIVTVPPLVQLVVRSLRNWPFQPVLRGSPMRIAAGGAMLSPSGGMMNPLARPALCLAILASASPAAAQFKNGSQTALLTLPQASPRVSVTERIGLTDVTIIYHRPQAKGRTVFGDIVPYDRVWRAGANDNTTIEFGDPVTIEGHPLAAGRYGVHMIPGPSEWTVIFSKNTTSWGSFTYDAAEDALRVKVKPAESPFREALTFEFTDLAADGALVSM